MAYGKFSKRSRAKSASKRGPYFRARGSSSVYHRGDYQGYAKQITRIPTMYNPVPSRLHNVVAPRFFTNLEFGFSGNTTVAAASAVFNVLGNALLNPADGTQDFTSIGTAVPATVALATLVPAGFPELLGLYRAYRVWSSKFTVSVVPNTIYSADGTMRFPKLTVLLPTTAANAVADPQALQSFPYSKAIICNQNSDTKSCTLNHWMDTKSILGLAQAEMQSNGSLVGTSAANPTTLWYWQVAIQDLGAVNLSAAATNQVSVLVRATYHVEFFSPDNLLQVD